jgi:hypothetical protein
MTYEQWQRELLAQRIREIGDVRFTIAGNTYPNYGAANGVVDCMVQSAIRSLGAGDLPACERWCMRAEREQIEAIRRMAR